MQWGLTFWNLNKHHCFIVLHIQFGRSLELCFRGIKPKPPPPWWRDCVAKLQLAFYCNWVRKILRLCSMSSLQDMLNFVYKHDWHNAFSGVYSASWVKPVLGLFCLHLNTIGWSGHVTSRPTIRRDNSLGFMSLWLGFRISAYGQGLRSSFRFSGSVFSVMQFS